MLFLLLIFTIFFLPIQSNDDESKKFISGWKDQIFKRAVRSFEDPQESIFTEEINNSELIINLRNPVYKNGILFTHEGGVIKNSDIRIQANTIQYIKRKEGEKEVHKIEAEGDLMVRYKNRVFVGEELEYDFISKTGNIYFGKTYASPWYMGGGKIELRSDGSYEVYNVSVTTCENADSSWDIRAESLKVSDKSMLDAKKVRFRLFKFLKLWIPSFKMNLKKFFTSPILKYKFNWDKGAGPRASFRYQAFSYSEFACFLRLDYRLSKGFGGAIETEYYPSHKRTTMETKNYLASDILPTDPKKRRRYRIQGAYHTISPSGTTKVDLTWDKYSDINMPGDFKSDDFEINTEKKTELFITHFQKDLISFVHARPRVNTFNSLKQDIPTFYSTIRPIYIPYVGIISNNWVNTSYLDYAYSNKLSPSLPDFYAWRLQTFNEIYRPFFLGPINFTPLVGVTGIFYSRSPNNTHSEALGTIFYSALLNTQIYRYFSNHKHLIEPYIYYYAISNPTSRTDDHYIFSLEDGYHRLNQLKFGLKNFLFSTKRHIGKASFDSDLYANFFIDDLCPKIPKIYLNLNWNLPSVYFLTSFAWNIHRQTLDYSNLRFGWTISRDLAFSCEFRYRSRYDYRKANHNNFIVDVARSETSILDSPLSDRRNTFLTKAFIRFNPYWYSEIESHTGWNRKNETFYNEYKIDLYTVLSTNWKARVSYQHTQTDDRFTWDIFLLKN